MKTILILGAGRSSASLIDYLLEQAQKNAWTLIVGDISIEAARERTRGSSIVRAITFDINHPDAATIVREADVIVSLLPPHLHPKAAALCVQFGKHLITASYVTKEMQAFHEEALSKNILLLNECGLDPGIDHMSAMQVIDRIRNDGGIITLFESFAGGLIAPETDPENPWRYKFTWNPRNVVMAGQATACFIEEGQYKYIPYQQLFKRTTSVSVPGYGEFEGYANRDSLRYIDTYNLKHAKTMWRGTLRMKHYCSTWNVLVQLGCCDDSYKMEGVAKMTHRTFINSFLLYHGDKSVEEKLCTEFSLDENGEEMKRLKWSGFFDDVLIGLNEGTPAQIIEHILNKRWKLNPQDKDMVVMWHRFGVEQAGKKREIQATLVVKGDDELHTAMAKTVGLPLGIAAKLLIQGKINARGVQIPITSEFYKPILQELVKYGVELQESEQ